MGGVGEGDRRGKNTSPLITPNQKGKRESFCKLGGRFIGEGDTTPHKKGKAMSRVVYWRLEKRKRDSTLSFLTRKKKKKEKKEDSIPQGVVYF